NTSGGATEPRVFLNQTRIIKSTLLKVQVADLQAAEKVLIAAAGGNSYQSLGRQRVDGHTVEILHFVLPVEQAGPFINAAFRLGSLIEPPQQHSEDITEKFASALDSYQALIARRSQATDSAEVYALDQQIRLLEQQLADWDREAGRQVVVVWLQE
ncbi:hypothetical protein, partial [Desulfofundulus sp.]|uniref:hypothetical protein n=1 Tax=Desulfofundulus sp. TaxID=2282750 RepID=UPI003C775095